MATYYVSVTGAGSINGTSEANAWTWAAYEAATLAAGDIVYIKAGTYPFTSTNNATIADSGTDIALIQFIGYNAIPGDLDDLDIVNDTPAMPLFNFATGRFLITGTGLVIKRIKISGNTNLATGQCNFGAATANIRFERCRVICLWTHANSSAIGTTSGSTRVRIEGCYLQATSSAPVINHAGTSAIFDDNHIVGGSIGLSVASTLYSIRHNMILSPSTYGISGVSSTSLCEILGNTFYGCTDCVRMTAVGTGGIEIKNNLFTNYTGYALNNTAANSTSLWCIRGNSYWGPSGTGQVNGITTGARSGDVTLASDPFVDAAGGNFATVASHAVRSAGLPGTFENATFQGYMTAGAVVGGAGSTNLTEDDLQAIHDKIISGGPGDRIAVDDTDHVVLGADQSHLTGLSATVDGAVDVGTILGEVPTLNADGKLHVSITYTGDEPYTDYNAIASGSGQTTSHVVFSSYPAGNQAGRQIQVTSGTGVGQWGILGAQTAAGQWDLKTGYLLTTPLDATSRVKFLGLGNTVAEIQNGIPKKGDALRYTNTVSSELADVIITDSP